MKLTASKIAALSLGATALCTTALPASAASFTQPGGTMGAPLGANPPTGFYFANSFNWGTGNDVAAGHTQSIGIEVPAFIWSTGYNFLGASYAASVAAVLVENGVHDTDYARGVYNTIVNPVSLSWNLGNGFFVSFQEVIYTPMKSDVVFATPGTSSGASFEQRVSVSYVANDWIISANNIFGITTNGSDGLRQPDYYNIDGTLARTFGKWELGAVAYGAFDLEKTNYMFINGLNRGQQVGVGGLLGYNFGVANLTLEATHQVLTRGFTNYPKDDTRVWTSLVIPIWNPAPPAPQPVVAKY